jgi:hypothetical protein
MILYITSYITIPSPHFIFLAAADPLPAHRAEANDENREPGRPMDFDKERDFADLGPLTVC